MMTVGTADLGECGRCGGTWVDGTTFEHIVAEKEEQALVLQASLPGFQEKRAQARIDRYWPCPVCHKLMNRVNFAHVSGVVLDVCRVHGVWFDGDELRQLVEFIRSGGLDRARAAERRENAARPDPSPIVVLQTGDEPDPHHDLVIEGALKVLGWLLRR
jgi:Zn-finger nucleic acid-binding protein